MARYLFCGLTLESNIPLEITTVAAEQPQYIFQFHPAQRFRPAPNYWFHHIYLPNGEQWLSLAKVKTGYLLRFSNLADFYVTATGKEIHCYPHPNTPLNTIQHLFLDQVMPLVLSHQGKCVLHASAVAIANRAVAFIGEAGWGKSTLAASFCVLGYPALTDDCLLLERQNGQIFGIPSYPGLRLWSDAFSSLSDADAALSPVAHYTRKQRLVSNNSGLPFCHDPHPLCQVYLLPSPEEMENTSTITIIPLLARDAFITLVKYSFHLDITDKKRTREEFEYLGQVANSVPCYKLNFPRDLSRLPEVREAILENINQPESS